MVKVLVLEKPQTGYYANASRSLTTRTLVHVRSGRHRPICGANVDDSEFLWCANRVAPEWIECRTCRRLLGLSKSPYGGRV